MWTYIEVGIIFKFDDVNLIKIYYLPSIVILYLVVVYLSAEFLKVLVLF